MHSPHDFVSIFIFNMNPMDGIFVMFWKLWRSRKPPQIRSSAATLDLTSALHSRVPI